MDIASVMATALDGPRYLHSGTQWKLKPAYNESTFILFVFNRVNQKGGASVSAKKKRLIMKQIKRQQKEENTMEGTSNMCALHVRDCLSDVVN